MPQLVGVPHHMDCRNLSILDFERGRGKLTIGPGRDETRQSVDETGTNQFRGMPAETFQRKHQRQGDVFFLLFYERIGKPGTDIGLALPARGLELIETKARDRAAQERLGLARRDAVPPVDDNDRQCEFDLFLFRELSLQGLIGASRQSGRR